MKFGGVQKLTLIDYPDKTAMTLFTIGCNFRCQFCYNTSLVLPRKNISVFSQKQILELIEKRKNFIDAVCITGGEPTLHKDLPSFIEKVKSLDLLVKLDTNGTNPQMLKDLVNARLIDYVAMDIKAPLEKYEQVVNCKVDLKKIKQTIKFLLSDKVDYEFRTTIMPKLFTLDDIITISEQLSGAKRYYLQKFQRKDKYVNKDFKSGRFTHKELEEILKKIKKYFKICEIR